MLAGVQTGDGSPHDKFNICRIAHVRKNRKDDIFIQRRLVQSFTYYIFEWGQGTCTCTLTNHTRRWTYSALRHFFWRGQDISYSFCPHCMWLILNGIHRILALISTIIVPAVPHQAASALHSRCQRWWPSWTGGSRTWWGPAGWGSTWPPSPASYTPTTEDSYCSNRVMRKIINGKREVPA